MSKFNEVFTEVQQSSFSVDEYVKLLDLIQFKRGRVGSANVHRLTIGSRVKIVSTKGTQYGTLLKVNKTKCQVKIDNDFRTWNVPFGMIAAE